jgi:hypothetical protein
LVNGGGGQGKSGTRHPLYSSAHSPILRVIGKRFPFIIFCVDREKMGAHINFEDNIFILNTRIRMIRNLLLLDAEPEFFMEQTLHDAEFINRTLAALLVRLTENNRYIEREEQFHNLSETESAYTEIISGILNSPGGISALQFPAVKDRLLYLQMQSMERKREIDKTAFASGDSSTPEPLVSPDELSELLKGLED